MNIDAIYAACEQFEKRAGLIKLPEEFFSDLLRRCIKTMAIYHINSAQRALEKETSKERIIELNRIINFAKMNIGDGVAEPRFMIDLDQSFFFEHEISKVEVTLNFMENISIPETLGTAGEREDKFVIKLNLPVSSFSLVHFQNHCKRMASILYHELSHVFQFTGHWQVGMPPKKIQTDHSYENMPEFNYDYYANINIEFYPLLKSDIDTFKLRYGKVPQKILANLARIWVGLPMIEDRNHPVFRSIESSEFFDALQESDLDKWGAAVKEFFKSLDIVK